MTRPPAEEWLCQAESDHLAGSRLLELGDDKVYCQSVSKFQQAVEKSVKALACFMEIDVGYRHDLADILRTMRRKLSGKSWSSHRLAVTPFLHRYEPEILALSRLAPGKPAKGELHRRNTEYPFELSGGEWIAPARAGVFVREDATRFRKVAGDVLFKTRKVVATLKRSASS